MDSYFTSFCLDKKYSNIQFHNIPATGVLCKIRLRKCFITGNKQLQKKERGHFEQRSAHQAKKQPKPCGWLE